MFAELATLLVYLALLVAGAYCVSEGGEILGSKYDATIVGGFVIAWLNTAPETIFFISALQAGKPEFAVGAMSGSVIVVSTVACGACIWCGSAARSSGSIVLQRGVRDQALILGASLIGVLVMVCTGFSYALVGVGICEYLAFVVYTLTRKSKDSAATVSASPGNHSHADSEQDDDDDEEKEEPLAKGIAYLLAGGTLIWMFSEPFIRVVASVGHASDMSTLVISFFCAPVASEAPEILEALSLSRKGKLQNINIAVSNLVGGTISKTTLLLGILSMYGVMRDYPYLPSYSMSLLLVFLCAGASAFIASQLDVVDGVWGKRLILLWAGTSLVQLFFNQSDVADAHVMTDPGVSAVGHF